jgi:hypothetical protein
MASYISQLVNQTVAPRVSTELQKHLRGFFGGIIRGYLPQVWWFITDGGSATLMVDRQGTSQVLDGQQGQPDASITWTDAAFHIALTTQDRRQLPPGTPEPRVQIYTKKGQAAYGQLRSRLGL